MENFRRIREEDCKIAVTFARYSLMFPPTSDRSVLLVDDSNDCRLLTERALRAAHPATRCVSLSSGDAAIRHLGKCGQHHRRPELLLLDWRMPGRSGAEVLAWARSQPHLMGLPILVVSGIAFPEDRRLAEKLGADGYLLKPGDLAGYHALVQQMDDWRGRLADRQSAAAVSRARPRPEPTLSHWERSARVLRAMVGGWVRTPRASRAAAREPMYLEKPSDQLTLDLVRLCRAQGIVPRDILQELPAGAAASSLAHQRRTVIRGLARRGWDTHELAEIFPLTPAAIRLLVRRRR